MFKDSYDPVMTMGHFTNTKDFSCKKHNVSWDCLGALSQNSRWKHNTINGDGVVENHSTISLRFVML